MEVDGSDHVRVELEDDAASAVAVIATVVGALLHDDDVSKRRGRAVGRSPSRLSSPSSARSLNVLLRLVVVACLLARSSGRAFRIRRPQRVVTVPLAGAAPAVAEALAWECRVEDSGGSSGPVVEVLGCAALARAVRVVVVPFRPRAANRLAAERERGVRELVPDSGVILTSDGRDLHAPAVRIPPLVVDVLVLGEVVEVQRRGIAALGLRVGACRLALHQVHVVRDLVRRSRFGIGVAALRDGA
mmetsp:Transcript_18355/g.52440  ORF Transcript_18355/g.52440 Transcript_18355/m.52440 type:complete len:245 (-) Transcript_18355:536-1270(-)